MIQKIAVIGNGGGGKTTLSRKLSEKLKLPLTHVDSIQFMKGMKIRPHGETIKILEDIQASDRWIIDGFGPLDIIEKRFAQADCIVFVDFPIWRHYWWCSKRQIKNFWSPRKELPEGCNEKSIQHTIKLFKTLWKVHTKMRPELLRILTRPGNQKKVVMIKNLKDWKKVFSTGI